MMCCGLSPARKAKPADRRQDRSSPSTTATRRIRRVRRRQEPPMYRRCSMADESGPEHPRAAAFSHGSVS